MTKNGFLSGIQKLPAVLWLLLVSLLASPVRAVEVPLQGDSLVRFATAEQGQAAVTRRDPFTKALSRFDLQSRLKTDREVTVDEFLKFTAEQVMDWQAGEIEKLTAVLQSIRPRLEGFKPLFPQIVLLVKTTGKEEGNAAYTRGNAVILPQSVLKQTKQQLQQLLTHELFHILSSHDSSRQRLLYAVIGFQPCGNIELPDGLASRKITNPDAPAIEYYIELTTDQGTVQAAPILYSSTLQYDVKKGGSFFQTMLFRLLLIRKEGDRWQAVQRQGKPVVIDARKVPSYYQQIGRNTNYIIHPDEILADNFVHLMNQSEKLKTPRIVQEMKRILKK